jgi:signal transduction histidine kinase
VAPDGRGVRRDAANRARIRSHAVTEAALAVDRQRRAAARLLHDEVIHALRAVSLPPGGHRSGHRAPAGRVTCWRGVRPRSVVRR